MDKVRGAGKDGRETHLVLDLAQLLLDVLLRPGGKGGKGSAAVVEEGTWSEQITSGHDTVGHRKTAADRDYTVPDVFAKG